MPSVPTVSEAGIAGVEVYCCNGLLVPTGTPKPIVERLHAEVVRIMKLPEVVERFAGLGAEPAYPTPAEFTRFIGEEIAKYAAIVRETGAKVD